MKNTTEYKVRTIEIDPHYRVKPYHLCSYAQDAVAGWLADLGFASYDLQAEGQTWILTGMYTSYARELPRWREELTVEIWARAARSFQFFIDFTISCIQSVYARGTSSWTVMDEESRRPVKRPDIAAALPITAEEACPAVSLRKIDSFDGQCTEFGRTVHSYDIDFNGHLNNVRYIGGALEAIPLSYRRQKSLASLHIKYLREAVQGDYITCHSFYRNDGGERFYHRLFNQNGEEVAAMNTQWY
jgi:acyl-CoA thioesterase FadM